MVDSVSYAIVVDVRMPFFSEFVMQSIMFCATQMIVVCFVFPWFTLPLIIMLAIFITLDVFMNEGVRQTKKLDNKSKSPVLHHLSSGMAGISIIRYDQMQS